MKNEFIFETDNKLTNRVNYIMWALFAILSSYQAYLEDSIGGITKYVILLWCFSMILLKAKHFQIRGFQICMIIWILYYLFTLLWTPNILQANIYVFSVLSMVLLFLLTTSFKYKIEYIYKIVFLYKYVSVSVAVLSLLYHEKMSMNTRQVLVLFGKWIDPNNQVALVALGSGLCLIGVFAERKIHRIVDVVAFAVCALSIFQCGSRSGMVILLLQINVILFFWHPPKETISKKIVKYLSITTLVVISYVILSKYVSDEIMERLLGTGSLKFTDGTNRDILWKAGWDYFLKSPLFGNGWGAHECHNTFLTILVDVGILGILPFAILLMKLAVDSIRQKNITSIMILISGMLPSFFIGAQNKRFFWISIILPAIMLYCVKDDKNANSKNG